MTMDYITTTGLRTQSSELVNALRRGGSVSLIHRSKVIGSIVSEDASEAPPINVGEFRKFLKSIKPTKLIPRSQRERVYRANLIKKYGKIIS